jgi:hypothetical protein
MVLPERGLGQCGPIWKSTLWLRRQVFDSYSLDPVCGLKSEDLSVKIELCFHRAHHALSTAEAMLLILEGQIRNRQSL